MNNKEKCVKELTKWVKNKFYPITNNTLVGLKFNGETLGIIFTTLYDPNRDNQYVHCYCGHLYRLDRTDNNFTMEEYIDFMLEVIKPTLNKYNIKEITFGDKLYIKEVWNDKVKNSWVFDKIIRWNNVKIYLEK
jgi:hypothetical protein